MRLDNKCNLLYPVKNFLIIDQSQNLLIIKIKIAVIVCQHGAATRHYFYLAILMSLLEPDSKHPE